MILAHVSQALYYDCRYDHRPMWALLVYMLSHLALFGNFYKQTYSKKGGRGGRGRRERGGGEQDAGDSGTHSTQTLDKKEQ